MHQPERNVRGWRPDPLQIAVTGTYWILGVLFLPWYRGQLLQDLMFVLLLAFVSFAIASVLLIVIGVLFGALASVMPGPAGFFTSPVALYGAAVLSVVVYGWLLSTYTGPPVLARDCYFAHPGGMVCD